MPDSDARDMTSSTVATTTAAGSTTTTTTTSHNGSNSGPGIVATVRVAVRRPVRVVSRSIDKRTLPPSASQPQQQQCHHSNGSGVHDKDKDVSGDTAAACDEACVLCGGGSVCSDTEDSVAAALRSGSYTKKNSKVGGDKEGSDDDDDDGSDDDNRPVDIKWTLTQLREYLRAHHPRGDDAWRIIEDGCSDVVIKALLSIESDVVERVRSECSDKSGRNCFELFGLDVMVDDALRVRLLEVNIMPSLATSTALDKAVKSRMLAHLLTLVRVVPHRRDAVPSTTTTPTAAADGSGVRSNGVCNSNRNSNGGGAAAGASRPVYSTAAMPRGPEATHPERVYAFGRHPNGGALLHDQPLLARFNDVSNAHSLLSPAEVLMLVEADEELRCAGGFRRIFPHPATVMRYLPYFTNGVRRNTYLLVSAIMMQAKKCK